MLPGKQILFFHKITLSSDGCSYTDANTKIPAQLVKRRHTDLAVLSLVTARNLPHCKRGSIAHSLSLSSQYCPDRTEILLKRGNITCHPSMHTQAGALSLILSKGECVTCTDIVMITLVILL